MLKKTGLVILDGWGIHKATKYNAVELAHKPFFDEIYSNYPSTLLEASGEAVGLPNNQIGNSEVGHINIGAGRIIQQSLTKINLAVQNNFSDNKIMLEKLKQCQDKGLALQIIALISKGGVHSHVSHVIALINLALQFKIKKIQIHAITDGRDTLPKICMESLSELEQITKEHNHINIASICGRFYAMDRDNRWERTQKAYDLIAQQSFEYNFDNVESAIKSAYDRRESDEFIKPTILKNFDKIDTNDLIMMMNFRVDRMRQLTEAFFQKNFTHFLRDRVYTNICTLTQYHNDYNLPVAFSPTQLENCYGEYIAKNSLKQLRIAETEKYPHVTFFFNGGKELCYNGEFRKLIPSPKVATYDLKPEMSASIVAQTLVNELQTNNIDTFICNFANADMVGHCGKLEKAIKAVEAVDKSLRMVCQAAYKLGWKLFITADHGNAEIMFDEQTQQPHTAHTLSPVPLVVVSDKKNFKLKNNGILADLSPSMLSSIGLDVPNAMTGRSLI